MASTVEVVTENPKGDGVSEAMQIESLCLNCHKQGITRLLISRIPFFREVVISSFECTECGFTNRSVDPAAPVQRKGKEFSLSVRCLRDLDRRLVHPSNSEIRLPSLDSSFPSAESGLTTVEGALNGIIDKLLLHQSERRKADPKQAEAIDAFIEKVRDLLTVKTPFRFVLDDPSGNGFIENTHAPLNDPQITCVQYTRTAEQNQLLGLEADDAENDDDLDNTLEETVSKFTVDCSNCHSPCTTNMKVSVVLMAINCAVCGFRDNEVKSASGIAEKGKKYTLLIESNRDLSRDVLKSETARVCLPELNIDTEAGTLGGRFTTVEGLLIFVRDEMKKLSPLLFGDSVSLEEKLGSLAVACDKIDQVLALELKGVHLVLDDPTGNSYLQTLNPDGNDDRLMVEEYQRSHDQDEELGLLDMKTENY